MPWIKIHTANDLHQAALKKRAVRYYNCYSKHEYNNAAWYCNASFQRVNKLLVEGKLEYRELPFVSFPFRRFKVTKNCNFNAMGLLEYSEGITHIEYDNIIDVVVAEFHTLEEWADNEIVFDLLCDKYNVIVYAPKDSLETANFMSDKIQRYFTDKQELIKYLNKQ